MDPFTVVLLVVLLVLAYLFINGAMWNSNLPPGPRRLPLIGNFLQVAGKDLRQVCKEYRKIYGDIFTLRVFNRTLIVVNGFEAIKDIAVENGDVFSERLKIDVLSAGIKGEGPRICIGEGLARMEISLFLAAMLQRFKFLPALDGDPPSFTTQFGLTAVPLPFKLRAIKRA